MRQANTSELFLYKNALSSTNGNFLLRERNISLHAIEVLATGGKCKYNSIFFLLRTNLNFLDRGLRAKISIVSVNGRGWGSRVSTHTKSDQTFNGDSTWRTIRTSCDLFPRIPSVTTPWGGEGDFDMSFSVLVPNISKDNKKEQ